MIRKISSGEIVDLAKLNKKNLRQLHYEEEKFAAQNIWSARPFSEDRSVYMKKMYEFANTIMPWYQPRSKQSYGANENSVGPVCEFLYADKRKKVVYEAGVGGGFSCQRFISIPNVEVKGCDVVISDKVKVLLEQYENLSIDEDTLYNSLKKLDDNCIDYFYADNVIEHLIPDEFPEILYLLSRKMKKNGLLFLVIPNRLDGPHDVSKYFLERGSRAEGAHFMEMSYKETLEKFKKEKIIPEYLTYRHQRKIKYVRDIFGILNKVKIGMESLLYYMLRKTGRGVNWIYKMGMTYYILVQK